MMTPFSGRQHSKSWLYQKFVVISLLATWCGQFFFVEASAGCDVCATSGQCYQAFNNMPGKFCGTFFNFKTNYGQMSNCCCPTESDCKISQNDCRCHVHSTKINQNAYQYQSNSFTSTPFVIIPILIISCCCLACCCYGCWKASDRDTMNMSKIPFATAVPAYNPAYKPDWSGGTYGSTYDRGNSGAANMAGAALGGLGLGTFLGNLMGSNDHHHHHAEGNTFFVDNSGGYDIAGDTGVSGGYDIAGDVGGGDISGDF